MCISVNVSVYKWMLYFVGVKVAVCCGVLAAIMRIAPYCKHKGATGAQHHVAHSSDSISNLAGQDIAGCMQSPVSLCSTQTRIRASRHYHVPACA